MCMPHRGRLNFLTCMLKFSPVIMFQKVSIGYLYVNVPTCNQVLKGQYRVLYVKVPTCSHVLKGHYRVPVC